MGHEIRATYYKKLLLPSVITSVTCHLPKTSLCVDVFSLTLMQIIVIFPSAPTVTVYEKSGVTLTLGCDRQSDSGLTVTLTACNSTDSDISSFTLQAAVPKVCFMFNNETLCFIVFTIQRVTQPKLTRGVQQTSCVGIYTVLWSNGFTSSQSCLWQNSRYFLGHTVLGIFVLYCL